MKILVIFTGGTIGSTVKGEYISTDGNKPRVIMEQYRQRGGRENVEFEYESPYTILSENLSGRNMAELGACVQRGLEKDYDGIVITHGTDTLQYSAAAISYGVGNVDIPIVLVSSNYVLEDSRANGGDNFYYGVDFICNHYGNGVFVSYRNQDGKTYIHSGLNVLAHEAYSDEIHSVGNQFYGLYENGIFKFNPEYRKKEVPCLGLPKGESSGVLRMAVHPGMCYPKDLQEIRGILLESYHSGTLCASVAEFQNFLLEANQKGIPVYLIGVNNETDYESVKEWEKSGIRILPMMSPVAAYMKIWLELENVM